MHTAAPQTPAHYPVLIIGAGINGCGLFRDLALQGVDCLLIDRGDVCEGASAASSRLIHGGLKYMETGEFRLVRESAIERNRLLRNAPHYVTPLETILPLRSWAGGILPTLLRFLGRKAKPGDRGVLVTEAGLRLYDAYSRNIAVLPDHRLLGRAAMRAEYPGFDPGVIAAALYHEAHVSHAERLGIELVLDGIAANPGSALATYTTAEATAEGTLRLTDEITGERRNVTAEVIVNAAGAWIDLVNARLGIASRHIAGSKGSHLVVANAELHSALNGRMIYFATADGRVCLAYPFFGHVLVGSTDIAVKDPDEAACSETETSYLLAALREIFPAIAVSRDQVVLAYCGVRPLPASDGMAIGAVSRDHAIATDALPQSGRPVLSLIGGKWTTFRAFAAETADRILALLGRSRRIATEDLAIGGGRGFPTAEADRRLWTASLAETFDLTRERAAQLLQRYGTRAEALAAHAAAGDDQPLGAIPGYSSGEIDFLCRHERVRRLADVLLRRTSIAMEGLLTPAAIEDAAAIAAPALGWDAARRAAETDHCLRELSRRQPQRLAA